MYDGLHNMQLLVTHNFALKGKVHVCRAHSVRYLGLHVHPLASVRGMLVSVASNFYSAFVTSLAGSITAL